MAGLQTQSNTSAGSSHALAQFAQLFEAGCHTAYAKEHWQQVLQLGFPHAKLEHWKYTPVASLLGNLFFTPQGASLTEQQLAELSLPIDAYRVVFVDGIWQPQLSDAQLGEFVVSLLGDDQSLPPAIDPEVFLHLTESLAEQKMLITLPAGCVSEKPLYLLHISSGRQGAREVNSVQHRHHVTIGRSAQTQIIEHYTSLDASRHFTGARLSIQVADNADVTHYKLAFENQGSFHFAHNDLLIGRDANVASHSFLLGAGLTRHHTSAQLNGENSQLVLNSLVLPIDDDVCDTRSYLEHNQSACTSHQMHKTIVTDRAKAVFNGKITVAKHAVKTDGKMTNNNLLLSTQAEVDSKPQLEIYADDVKCSHGATVGRIDDEQLFYLSSRGITQQDAKQMIIFAFAAELTESIKLNSLRQVVISRISQRLQRGLS
jgi:Fe-S cluster assembly protein SufD